MNVDEIYEVIDKLTLEEKIPIYDRLKANIENEELLKEAEYRMMNTKDDDFVSANEVLKIISIDKEQLNDITVDLK